MKQRFIKALFLDSWLKIVISGKSADCKKSRTKRRGLNFVFKIMKDIKERYILITNKVFLSLSPGK